MFASYGMYTISINSTCFKKYVSCHHKRSANNRVLVLYLHPKQKIDQVIPINGWEHKQQLHGCVVVVSWEGRNIKRRPKVCIVVEHDSSSDNLIYCAERYVKVKVESEPDGYFGKMVLDLSIINNAPMFSPDDVCKPIDTSLLDMGGSGSRRSEDIALACSQGFDVDGNSKPAQY